MKNLYQKFIQNIITYPHRYIIFMLIWLALPYINLGLLKLFGWPLSMKRDLVILFLVAFPLFKLDSRISIGAGIGCLVLAPLLIIGKMEGLADQIAVIAYYFLLFGAVLSFVEIIKDKRREKKAFVV